MEIEENTAARVQDASFLQKDAVVDEKLHNAIETTATSEESLEIIKKSEADCSSAMNSSTLDKINDEKDDLLEQIEEVCNDKTSNLKNSTEISKTSEHEFLKEIEEMEKKELDQKANNDELKAKEILECEASTVDAVVVGDKILIVKEDEVTRTSTEPASMTVNETPIPVSTDKVDLTCGSSSDVEIVSKDKDATVSSSTNKIETNDQNLSEKSVSKQPDEPVQSTGSYNLVEEEKKTPVVVVDLIDEQMEVDNDTADKNTLGEETDDNMKSLPSDSDVEIVSTNLDNEAKSKTTTTEAKSEAVQNSDVEMVILDDEKTPETVDVTESKPVDKTIDTEETEKAPEVTATPSKIVETTTEPVAETTKSDNKPVLEVKLKENIVSSSLTNTPVSSSMVFNSTPIQKQFEISSENVSKITDAAELSHNEKEEASSTKALTIESGTCANSETDQLSSDGTIKKYINAIKKYNGMPDTTTDEEDTSTPARIRTINKDFDIKIDHLSDVKKDSTYEVNVYCEKNDVRYLSIERIDFSNNRNKSQVEKTSASESSVQSSSNGSVTSLPTFSLPQAVETTTTTSASTSTSISTNCNSITASRNTHTILGIEELCNFMINQFTKIKHTINPESIKVETTESVETPNQQSKRNKNKNSPSGETPTASASKTKRVRKRSLQEDELEVTPKSKQAKRDTVKETPKKDDTSESGDSKVGPCVLAKWVDKKFYAGKITGEKPGNKYVVLFEDGASKTLAKDAIVFGEGDTLPLQDQQVYALVDEDYERGVVLSIEKTSDKVLYAVKTENSTVNVTASDIYLEVEQAKEIQKIQNIKMGICTEEEETGGSRPSRNKRPPASPSTPEAGYSGATGKRGGKRQKRLPFYSAPTKRRLSESSNSSDTLESTPPDSPKEMTGLELVEGVQPELQNTHNDSELSRMIFISEYKKSQPNCDVDELLGPLPKSNILFRNKHFLLTCTVGLRPHRFHQENNDDTENKRFKQFSAAPYIKHHLQRQLEAGGAKIYTYFEDVPKNKYKQCKLIAPKPCLTAKYVQCLSSDIQAISHDWVIDSCRQNRLADLNKYQLPAGWSIISEAFVPWKIRKSIVQPFAKTYVLIAGEHNDFIELWGRVCKAAGAKIRLIKSLDDITPTTTGYMVAESDISHAIKAKAQHYGIPVVSTVWVVQSLIMGTICLPSSHPKLTQLFEDDEI